MKQEPTNIVSDHYSKQQNGDTGNLQIYITFKIPISTAAI